MSNMNVPAAGVPSFSACQVPSFDSTKKNDFLLREVNGISLLFSCSHLGVMVHLYDQQNLERFREVKPEHLPIELRQKIELSQLKAFLDASSVRLTWAGEEPALRMHVRGCGGMYAAVQRPDPSDRARLLINGGRYREALVELDRLLAEGHRDPHHGYGLPMLAMRANCIGKIAPRDEIAARLVLVQAAADVAKKERDGGDYLRGFFYGCGWNVLFDLYAKYDRAENYEMRLKECLDMHFYPPVCAGWLASYPNTLPLKQKLAAARAITEAFPKMEGSFKCFGMRAELEVELGYYKDAVASFTTGFNLCPAEFRHDIRALKYIEGMARAGWIAEAWDACTLCVRDGFGELNYRVCYAVGVLDAWTGHPARAKDVFKFALQELDKPLVMPSPGHKEIVMAALRETEAAIRDRNIDRLKITLRLGFEAGSIAFAGARLATGDITAVVSLGLSARSVRNILREAERRGGQRQAHLQDRVGFRGMADEKHMG